MLKRILDEIKGAWVVTAAVTQSRLRFGHNIYDSEWDVLIILDACRVDALREVADKFDFISEIDTKWSRGSTSKEWLENTFVKENADEVAKTAYVTANSFARKLQNEKINRLDYISGSDSALTQYDWLERAVLNRHTAAR